MKTFGLMLSLVLLGGWAWGQEWEIEYLPELPGTLYSWAIAGNDRGQIVGNCRVGNIQTPVLWEKGNVYPLPIPENYQYAETRDINNSGLIVGDAYYEAPGPLGDRIAICVWNTQGELAATIEVFEHTRVLDIRDDGVVFGYARSLLSFERFLYFTWTQQKGTEEIAYLYRLDIHGAVRGDKVVGELASHAVVLEKAHGE